MNMMRQIPRDMMPHLPFVLGLIVLAIYVFYLIFIYYLMSEHSPFDKFLVYFATGCLFMFYWSFRIAVCTEPGYVPKGNLDENDESIAGLTEQQLRDKRFCAVCKGFKPERSHHCSQCRRCVLNMDHHCVWTGNCVGYYNRKAFNLVLQWGSLAISIGALFGIRYAYDVVKDIIFDMENDEFIWMAVHCVCFLIILGGFSNALGLVFFARSHLLYVMNNVTTLDSLKGKRESEYSMGKFDNFKFYFGKNPLLWFAPVGAPLGDGYAWTKINDMVTNTIT